MTQVGIAPASWRRSSRCEGGHCVEMAPLGTAVALRKSTEPGIALTLAADAWRAFIADVRGGKFDLR